MKKTDLLVAVAGWEDRCGLGIERDLDVYQPSKLVLIVFEDKEYARLTEGLRSALKASATARSLDYEEILVRRTDPAGVWTRLYDRLATPVSGDHSTVVDISTMPREVIWWVFGALEKSGSSVSYIYYRPQQYADGWVTRDTDQPRLVYQRSGVTDFSKRTCLLLISGFDVDRAAQLIQFFEPELIIIGLQKGVQFDNETNNIERNKIAIGRTPSVRYFEMDAYSSDHGLAAMEAELGDEFEKFNIVAASLGPKLSAVALYLLNRKRNDLALAYAASRQINSNYSSGVGDPIVGALERVTDGGTKG